MGNARAGDVEDGVVLATLDGVRAAEAGLLSSEQRDGLRSWTKMAGGYDAPLPIRFISVKGGWRYASVGTRFELIIGPHPGHLLVLRTALVMKIECYCICGMQAERVARPGTEYLYYFKLDLLHSTMYAALRSSYYHIYGPYDRRLPRWAVKELAETCRFAITTIKQHDKQKLEGEVVR